MTRTWMLTLAFAALPLAAAEQAKTTKPASAKTATAAQAQPAQTPVVSVTDSPLVRASKLANRLGRKSSGPVITMQTLARSGRTAHVSTTAVQAPIQVPGPPPTPTAEMVHVENRARAQQEQRIEADKQAKARAEAEHRLARTAAAVDEGYDGGQGDDAEEISTGPDGKPPV
jgi:hypothetical protein